MTNNIEVLRGHLEWIVRNLDNPEKAAKHTYRGMAAIKHVAAQALAALGGEQAKDPTMTTERKARELPEMPTPAIVHVNEPRHFYTAKQMREYARQAITRALESAGQGEAWNEDGPIYVDEDSGSLHIDLQNGGTKRQFSLIAQRRGSVKFAIYVAGEGSWHGDVNDDSFIPALRAYAGLSEPQQPEAQVQCTNRGRCECIGACKHGRGGNGAEAQAGGAVDVTGFGTPPLMHEERPDAEKAYSLTAFDYAAAPIGSRDWSLYWRGWWHRSMVYTTQPAKVPEGMVRVEVAVVSDLMDALHSFAATAEDEECYTVSSELMSRLAMLGAVYRAKRAGWYYLTDFGRMLLAAAPAPKEGV